MFGFVSPIFWSFKLSIYFYLELFWLFSFFTYTWFELDISQIQLLHIFFCIQLVHFQDLVILLLACLFLAIIFFSYEFYILYVIWSFISLIITVILFSYRFNYYRKWLILYVMIFLRCFIFINRNCIIYQQMWYRSISKWNQTKINT